MLRGSINLSKINKEHLFVSAKGDKYLNITVWENDEPDKFGNTHSIKQSIPKEARDAGQKEGYVGNLKTGGKTAPKKEVPSEDEPW